MRSVGWIQRIFARAFCCRWKALTNACPPLLVWLRLTKTGVESIEPRQKPGLLLEGLKTGRAQVLILASLFESIHDQSQLLPSLLGWEKERTAKKQGKGWWGRKEERKKKNLRSLRTAKTLSRSETLLGHVLLSSTAWSTWLNWSKLDRILFQPQLSVTQLSNKSW